MKHLLVVGKKETSQFSLLEPLLTSFSIEIEATCPPVTSAEAMLAWNIKKDQLEQLVANSPNLKWVHTKSAGVEGLIGEKLRHSSVILTNAQGVFADSLAEFALTGMLYFAKNISLMKQNQGSKHWSAFEVNCLKGATVGILGFGGIGQQIAKRCVAFGMKVVAFRTKVVAGGENYHGAEVFPVSRFDEFLPKFDYLTVSLPATSETTNFLNEERLSRLDSTTVIVNVGRGSTIDESVLTKLLRDKKIKGAALDVFAVEPLPETSELWSLSNVLISPHTADRTATWLDETMQLFVENAQRFASGTELLNIVDKIRGY